MPALAVGLALAAVLLPTPASAQVDIDYGGICSITITPQQLAAGGQALVEGVDFQPDFNTQIVLDEGTANEVVLLTPVVTDASGSFAEQVTIPANTAAGTHTISAECDTDAFVDGDIEVLGGGLLAPTLVVDPNAINCAGALTGFAANTQPGSQVTFRVQTPEVVLASATANASGRADFAVADFAASRAAGTYTIVSSGVDASGAAFSLSDSVIVTKDNCNAVTPTTRSAGGATGPTATARTGTDVGPQVAAGVGILGVGAIFVASSRRRQSKVVAR